MEILIQPNMHHKGLRMLQALVATAPAPHTVVDRPSGRARVLMTYGVGDPERMKVVEEHRARGGTSVLWDMGYFATKDFIGGMRLSVNEWHPQRLLDRAPRDSSRWDALHLSLRNDYDPKGPIILVGMGPKTRAIVSDPHWEVAALAKLKRRFPRHRIIFRPKPGRSHPTIPCQIDGRSPIEQVLKGASLVVCRHSNVALDAVVAGVPFEASDGAAKWLDGKPYTAENRLELLWRCMWFNWRPDEAAQAWKMVLKCL
jgi:hypothetical protein